MSMQISKVLLSSFHVDTKERTVESWRTHSMHSVLGSVPSTVKKREEMKKKDYAKYAFPPK